MEFGAVTFMPSKFLSSGVIAIYRTVRKPGFIYKFSHYRANLYRCCRCREVNKDRYITIVDSCVTGRKHPEDGHHPDCEPIPEMAVRAQELDRDMRLQVYNNTVKHVLIPAFRVRWIAKFNFSVSVQNFQTFRLSV